MPRFHRFVYSQFNVDYKLSQEILTKMTLSKIHELKVESMNLLKTD